MKRLEFFEQMQRVLRLVTLGGLALNKSKELHRFSDTLLILHTVPVNHTVPQALTRYDINYL